jgi:hypothetical protein
MCYGTAFTTDINIENETKQKLSPLATPKLNTKISFLKKRGKKFLN